VKKTLFILLLLAPLVFSLASGRTRPASPYKIKDENFVSQRYEATEATISTVKALNKSMKEARIKYEGE